MIVAKPSSDRIADTVRFYEYLNRIEDLAGGFQTLATCDRTWIGHDMVCIFFSRKARNESSPAKVAVWCGLAKRVPDYGIGSTSTGVAPSLVEGNTVA